MTKKKSPKSKDSSEPKNKYVVVSRTGTNSLSVAVQAAMDEGYNPIGGVSVSSELKGRERVITYHQSLVLLD